MRNKDKIRYKKLTDWQLTLAYQCKDDLALEYLMLKYEKYIHKIASLYYWKTSLENDDILAEARIGFMEGVRKLKTEGYFMYFTSLWMKAKIFLSIDVNNKLIRIPVNRLKERRKINSILTFSTDEHYSPNDISIKTGIDKEKVEKYLHTNDKIFDINNFYLLEDDSLNNVYDIFNIADLHHDLLNILGTLSETEYYIITRLYGLFDEVKMDKVDIGDNLNISSERVRQIKDRVIRRFRHSSYSSLLLQYLN